MSEKKNLNRRSFMNRVAGAAMLTRSPDVDLSSYRFTPLQTMPEYEGSPSFSPDGRTIAYVADVNGVLQVFARSLETNRASSFWISAESSSMMAARSRVAKVA